MLYTVGVLCCTSVFGSTIPTNSSTNSTSDLKRSKPWLFRNDSMVDPFCVAKKWDFQDGKIPSEFDVPKDAKVSVNNGSLVVTMVPSKENSSFGYSPRITSGNYYMLYGTINVRMKVQAIAGVVSFFTLIANGTNSGDGRDEIDWEFVGNRKNEVDSNIFANYHVIYNTYAKTNRVNNNENYHNYSVDWSPDKMSWYIDGIKVHETNPTYNRNVRDWIYPVTPLHLSFGLWDASSKASWTGGVIDWNRYGTSGISIEIDSIEVVCNHGSNEPPAQYQPTSAVDTTPTATATSTPTPTSAELSLGPTLLLTLAMALACTLLW